jgi:hypothetical protein
VLPEATMLIPMEAQTVKGIGGGAMGLVLSKAF